MRNRYPGVCFRCGLRVEKGAGHFQRDRKTGSWLTQHADCAIKYRGTKVGYALPATPERAKEGK